MSIAAFDTLTYARRLKEAGVDETQAEAHAEAVRDAVTEGVATKDDVAALKADLDRGLAAVKADVVRLEDKMATKEDVAALRAELKADMADLKAELKADVAELKTDVANLETRLVRFVFAAAAGQVALIVGLLKLIP